MPGPKRRWPWIASLAVVVGLLGGLATLHSFAPLDEWAQWAGGSEVHELDDTPAPVAPSAPRVLVFALDGVGRDNFSALLEVDSRLGALLGQPLDGPGPDTVYEHGCELREALSILPSTTVAAWTSALTGEPVAQTGISGNEWFAREEARFFAPAPVSVSGHEHTLRVLNDGLLGAQVEVPTVFERVEGRSHASLIHLYRGADAFTVPDAVALSGLFGAFVEGLTEEPAAQRAVYAHADEASVESILEALEEHGLPELQVVYFPGIDLFTHGADEPLRDQRAYLRDITAPVVDEVLAAFEEEASDTTVIFISDHGHTPVLADDRHALSVGQSDEPTAVLEALGFRVRAPTLETDAHDFSAVVAYQGAIAYVYLADRSRCPDEGDACDWARPPRFEEDVLPVARAFAAAGRGEAEVTGGLEGALDLVFARRPGPEAVGFSILDAEGELVSVEAYLARTPRPELLRLPERVRAMSEGPHGDRVGDVMLLARAGAHEAIEDRFYFSNPYRSWHGSPAASDSRVTFVVANGARSGEELCALTQSVTGAAPSQRHLTPLVERLLR